MAMYIRKVPTVLSLAQLAEDGDDVVAGGFCSPDEPISACYDRVIPSILYPFSEGSLPHRVRSFGGLSSASIARDLLERSHAALPVAADALRTPSPDQLSPLSLPPISTTAPDMHTGTAAAAMDVDTVASPAGAPLSGDAALPDARDGGPTTGGAAAAVKAAAGAVVEGVKGALGVATGAANDGSQPSLMRGDGDAESELSTDTDEMPDGEGGAMARALPDRVLVREWDRRSAQGLFRYDVTVCETKVTQGVYGFIAQLNEGRATKKRATEFRVDQVVQPFEPAKFNFTKAAMKEVLFQFTAGAVTRTTYAAHGTCTASPNLALINVSPIEYGHVLLVPRVNDQIPQLVDQTTMLFALQFVMEVGNPYFRLGYNSLGAFGTINHLHFQGYYLNEPYPVEIAPTAPVSDFPSKVRGVQVERLQAYPVHGWVFTGAANVDSMAALVGAICMKLQVLNVPHNLLICDMGSRVILWPQNFAEKQALGRVPDSILEMGVNPAAFEIAGHMVLKRREDYEALTQESAWALLEHVSLTGVEMEALQARVFTGFV